MRSERAAGICESRQPAVGVNASTERLHAHAATTEVGQPLRPTPIDMPVEGPVAGFVTPDFQLTRYC
jgi:hypothetical protein